MFGAKIRKIGMVYPCIPQFCYIKVGFNGVYMSQMCYPDVEPSLSDLRADNWTTDAGFQLTEFVNYADSQ